MQSKRRNYHQKPKSHHRTPKTSWESVSGWYGEYMGKQGGDYQRDIVFPGAMHLLAPKKDGHYLDLACGQGAFTKMLASKSSQVDGLDASKSLIDLAKKNATKNMRFLVGDATDFAHQFSTTKFDGIVCNLAIQNIDPLGPVFADATRILKSGGVLVLTMNHPAFRQPRQSGWGWDEERKLQYRRVDKYLGEYEMPIIAHPGSAPHVKTYSYHRPLASYMTELAKHGFMIDALEEWASNKNSDSGPRAKAENIARAEIPLFLGLRARKIN
jgi:ubiquinone/menaquinone biosynthesis C-methylase UbiE